MLDVRIQSDFTSPFAQSGSVQFLETGGGGGCSNEGYSNGFVLICDYVKKHLGSLKVLANLNHCIRFCCTPIKSEAPAVFNIITIFNYMINIH